MDAGELGKPLLFCGRKGRGNGRRPAFTGQKHKGKSASQQDRQGGKPQQRRVPLEGRAQQDERAVSGYQEIEHLRVAVAGAQPLPHENP